MLATPVEAVPPGPGWQHEVKWDGMRALVEVRGSTVRVFSRTEREVTPAFPELCGPDSGITGYADLLLDGEVVVMGPDGRPSFATLAERFHLTDAAAAARMAVAAPVCLMVFDVLRAMNRPTTAMRLSDRRHLVEGLGLSGPHVRTPPVFDDGAALITATAQHRFEGVVSKRLGSTYQPGRRSGDWRKTVHRATGSFVVCGWLPERTSSRLGSVHLATPTASGGLAYRGLVGSGLAGRAGESLRAQLVALGVDNSPFTDPVPPEALRDAHWVRPELIADIEFHGVTAGERLRQPTWRGLRADLTTADLIELEG
ncbi:bifunctional non-homologous end joining protein LigD [Rudaeicoccus suwonensis]|uniref:DNA ligase (ATP) n=2 Tax=Rudaeicoccus suwonensis TaxID=657409 RepID=A0A561E2V9_9MICO|nr:bifunctional non-homologous end joining protein LigD [Rudaeicoccus suwonensis]